MAEIIRFHDEDGDAVLIETSGSSSTIRDVAGGDVLRTAGKSFDAVLHQVRVMTERVSRELARMEAAPDGLTIEMGISVNARADVIIAKAATEGSLKVTLSWRGPRGARARRPRT